MLGLYTWEIIIQLPFDWSVISCRVRFNSFVFVKQNNLISTRHTLTTLVGMHCG